MTSPDACTLYPVALRRTLFAAGLNLLLAALLAVPALYGLWFAAVALYSGPFWGGAIVLPVLALITWLLWRMGVKCLLWAKAVLRNPGYPERHWSCVHRDLGHLVVTELTAGALGASLTVGAIWGGDWAPALVGLASVVDAIFLLLLLAFVSSLDDTVRFAQVVPYFRSKVGEIDTFCHGQHVARNCAELDDLARSMGLTPLSDFGWNDDLAGEPLVWHDPGKGLKTVNSLLARVRGEDLASDDRAGLLDDLKRIAHALARAEEQGISFCLLLRHTQATSGQEWEVRKGTCF